VRHVDQQRRIGGAPRAVAADGERAERVAVIALAARDDVAALRLADLDEILARHLQRRFDRLRAAGHEIGVRGAGRGVFDQALGQALGDFGREKARVRIGEPVDLGVHRRQHVGMAVAQAGHGRAARAVEVSLAVAVVQPGALAGNGRRWRMPQRAMQHAGLVHGEIRLKSG